MSKRTLPLNPETQNPKISTDKPINKNQKLNQFKVKYFEKNKNTMWGFQKNLQEISNGFNSGSFVNPNFIASYYESLLIWQSILHQAPKSQMVRQSPWPWPCPGSDYPVKHHSYFAPFIWFRDWVSFGCWGLKNAIWGMVINGSVGLNVCGCVDVCILTWVLGLCFDRSLVYTLMVLLDLICISFLGVCSSCEECFDLFGLLVLTYYVLE